jgi:hypothetical protein
MVSYKKKFLEKHGLPPKATLDLLALSALSNIPYNALHIIFKRGEVVQHTETPKFSFEKVKKCNPKKKGMERCYDFIMGGKSFTELDKDVADSYGMSTA